MEKEKQSVIEMAEATSKAPTEYEIVLAGDIITRDAGTEEKMRALDFTNEQAQFVYSMAEETFLPAMAKVAEKFRAARELEKLENYFGGEARFDEIARQISAWANKNIDAATFETLSTTYTGVISLYNMMKNGEPALLGSRVANDDHVSEEKLRKMMRDPKYWRDNDEAFIKKIDEGFKNLYAKK